MYDITFSINNKTTLKSFITVEYKNAARTVEIPTVPPGKSFNVTFRLLGVTYNSYVKYKVYSEKIDIVNSVSVKTYVMRDVNCNRICILRENRTLNQEDLRNFVVRMLYNRFFKETIKIEIF